MGAACLFPKKGKSEQGYWWSSGGWRRLPDGAGVRRQLSLLFEDIGELEDIGDDAAAVAVGTQEIG